MEQLQKISVSKWFICLSCSLAGFFALYEDLIAPVFPNLYQPDPFSILETILGIVVLYL